MLLQKATASGCVISRRGHRLRRASLAIATAAISVWATRHSLGGQQSATWNGYSGVGGIGDWGTATEWQAGVVPDNNDTATYIVNVDGGKAATSAVTVSSTYTIDALNISSGDSVAVQDSSSLGMVNGGLSLNGTLSANASVFYSNIVFDQASNTAVTGTGSIVLNSSSSAVASLINYSTSTVSLPSAVSVSAPNGGSISGNFTSAATVTGAGAAATLTVGGGFVNTGNVIANAGSTLSVYQFDNTSGTITVNAATLNLGDGFTTASLGKINRNGSGSSINIVGALNNAGATLNLNSSTGSWGLSQGGSISQGTIATTGGAQLLVGPNGVLTDVTVASSSTVDVQDEGYVTISGGINLNGATLRADATASYSSIIFDDAGNQTLGTSGNVILNSSNGAIAGLVNASTTGSVLITSAINISAPTGGSITGLFTNAGKIYGSGAGAILTVDGQSAGGFINTGTINASGGSILNLNNFNNAGGTVIANASTVNLGGAFTTAQLGAINRTGTGSSVNIVGMLNNSTATLTLTNTTGSWGLNDGGVIYQGTITTTGSAQLLAGSDASVTGTTLTSGSTIDVQDEGDLTISGGMTLNGTIRADAATSYSYILFNDAGNESVTGTGNIVLNASGGSTAALSNSSTTGRVSIGSGITITAPTGGSISGAITSAASITGSGSGSTLTIDGQAAEGFINTGTITANGGSTLDLNNFNNAGGSVVASSATVNLGGNFSTADVGTITRTGSASAVNIVGVLNNSGKTFTLTNTTGSWGLLDDGTISGGTFTTTGSAQLLAGANSTLQGINLSSGSTVAVQDGGYLYINGAMILNGTLRADTATSYSQIIFNDVNDQTIGGTGAIILNQSGSAIASILNDSAAGIVNLGAGLTISALNGGNISGYFASSATILNSGANHTLNIDSGSTSQFILFKNSGLISVTSSGILTGTSIENLPAGNINDSGGAFAYLTGMQNYGAIYVNSAEMQFTGGWINNLNATVTATNLGAISSTGATSNSGTITLTNAFFFGGGETFTNLGQVNLSAGDNFNAVSGTLALNGGTFNQTGGVVNATQVTIAPAASVTANFNVSGGLANVTTLLASISGGSGRINVTGTGTLNISSGLTVRTGNVLTIGTGGVVNLLPHSGTYTAAVVSSLVISGKLDLSNNALDVTAPGLATLQAVVQQGYANGTWTGVGISSSKAAADTTHLTAVGIIQNNQGGAAIYGSGTGQKLFEGVAPAASDVLAKYTYYGDTNLDGKVDASDYSRIDAAYLADKTNPTADTGWYNGDFNYDGVVNGSDYTLMDNAFNRQGALLTDSIAGPGVEIAAQIASPTAVPEPAGFGIVATALFGLSRRRSSAGKPFRSKMKSISW